ncbi:MAG: hypothetical protein JST12_19895 [Armatimonadetes bacterium]|nr:hypothetical protein [Armatimonadota bacterium]
MQSETISPIQQRVQRSGSAPKLARELSESNGVMTTEQFDQVLECFTAIGNGLAYLLRGSPQNHLWGITSNLWSYSEVLVAEAAEHTQLHFAQSLTLGGWVGHEAREPETFSWKHFLLKDDRLVLRLSIYGIDFILEQITKPEED